MGIEQHASKAVAPAVAGYDLAERIGRGPRFDVWRAAATSTGRACAVKIVLPEVARRPSFLTLFEKESTALRALLHPNVVATHDRGKSGAQFFLAQDLASGSLRDSLRAGAMPLSRAIKVTTGICEALDYAHRRGLPHRHLVADNVFLVNDVARVSDFGMAQLSATSNAAFDVAADLVDLAALFHELVTGEPPPPRFNTLEGRVAGASKRLDELFTRALAPNPAARFRRASEFSLALTLLGTDEGSRVDARSDDRGEAVAVLAREKLVVISFAAATTLERVKESLRSLELTLSAGGPWKIAYDLSAMSLMDDALQDQILRLHVRNLKNLARVAFCSPRAMVRASALVIGRLNDQQLPWKVFSTPEPMRAWLKEVA